MSRIFYSMLFMALIISITPAFAVDLADKDAAKAAVAHFNDTLLSTMKDAKTLGYEGRVNKLTPVVDKTFDLPLMTRLLVGPQWNGFTAQKQAALLAGFRRFTLGSYASRFDGYNGEQFEITSDPVEQKDDVLVPTQLVMKSGEPIKLNYLLRKEDKGWQIIDIYLEGTISQIATQRAEFQSVLSQNGVDGLLTTLDKKTADLAASGGAPTSIQ